MKRLLLIFLPLVCLALFNHRAPYCECSEYGTPICAMFWRADAVFAGQLVDIQPLEQKTDDDIPSAKLRFLVEQPYRGVSGAYIELVTPWKTMCALRFEKGKRYLVYASLDEDTKQLSTGLCSGSKSLNEADDDLAYVRSVTRDDAGESISGKLAKNKVFGVPAVRVKVEGNDKTFETVTDEHGDFSISLPGPGTFKVRGSVPFAAGVMRWDGVEVKSSATDSLTTFEYEVKLEKNQCNYAELDVFNIDLHATAILSGHVLTSAGRAVTKGWVYLIDVADSNHSYLKSLAEDGAFKFEEIRSGEYYLVLNPHNVPPHNEDPPYPRTYFPSAADPAEATKIVVTEGSKLDDLTLRVGPPLRQRRVSGTVVWKDGRALEDAYVIVYAGTNYFRRVDLEKKAKFDFVIYGDFDYSIEAGDDHGEIEGRSERVKLTPANSTGLKLVLRRVEE